MRAPAETGEPRRTRIVVLIDGELVRLLRHMAIDRSTTIRALVERAIRDLLEARGSLDKEGRA